MSIQKTIESMLASRKKFDEILAKGTKLKMQTAAERFACPTPTGFVECDMTDDERQEVQDSIDKLDIAIRERRSILGFFDSQST